MHSPNNGKTPVQETDVRLCFDDMYLYMGTSMYYNDTGMITRIGYNPREGSDFYIVYNEGINSSVRTNFLIDQGNENRTILLKYTYTFAF
jgi:hypothetical protein